MEKFTIFIGCGRVEVKTNINLFDILSVQKGYKNFFSKSTFDNLDFQINLNFRPKRLFQKEIILEVKYMKGGKVLDSYIIDSFSFDKNEVRKQIERVIIKIFDYYDNSLYVHASGIVESGKGAIFAGPAESGKSTVIKYFPKAKILCEDRILIKYDDKFKEYLIWAVPHKGAERILEYEHVVLDKIYFIVPSYSRKSNIVKLKPTVAFIQFLKNSIWYNTEIEKVNHKFLFLDKLVNAINCYKLSFSLKDVDCLNNGTNIVN